MSIFDGKQALIIEDDPASVKVLQQLLQQVSIPATVILRGDNITNDLQDVAIPDVIFLDLEMPGANGYDVLEVINSLDDFQGIPVVAYTTHLSHMNEARYAGFHSFLGKPLDSHAFADQLARILNDEAVWEISE